MHLVSLPILFIMPAKFNVNYLKSEELIYELEIRGIAAPPSGIDDKRKVLRGLLAQEDANRSLSTLTVTESFKDTAKAARNVIKDVSEILVKPKADFLTSDHARCVTKLTHITGRVRRSKPADADELAEHQRLLSKVLCLEADLAEKVDPSPPEPDTPIGFQSTPVSPQQFSFSKKVPVFKWGIKKFNGKGSLMSFLELVESLKSSRGCSDSDLFNSAGDLFEADAWTWWYTNFSQGRFCDWKDLVNKLKRTFLNSDYDQIILDEIRASRQRLSEPVSIYISSIEAKFHRLTRLPAEEEMVAIIRRNLLPDYVKALILQDVKSIPDLIALCKRVEDALSFTSLGPSASNVGKAATPRTERVCLLSGPKLTCWNCGQPNHKYSNCGRRRNLFCFGCGNKGVDKNRCRDCSKNASTSHERADIAGSSRTPSSANKVKQGAIPKRR